MKEQADLKIEKQSDILCNMLSYISGSVDFIFGNASAVFDNSIIHSLRAGYVTAASTEENKPGGWNNWGKESNEQTARFGEFDSFGPGARGSERVPWAKQLTADEASQYTVEAVNSTTKQCAW
ncbi:pectin methylesterase-like acyl-CoA thioesterase [Paenibacillus brasilensis]|uniref:Pectinesterase n=1 Tax=Paenibacillus brasilensis TaxID=128574 RepID=A0ABU0L5N1_9BACL|nr:MULTISPECIES: pectinesterase family protein [Paenibacillus]MDQ0496611.1 pectin methylesterase-like acyl-CoA thioesterase [Paenibacillus brasilensis]